MIDIVVLILFSFIATQLTPAWSLFGSRISIHYKPFGFASVSEPNNIISTNIVRYVCILSSEY